MDTLNNVSKTKKLLFVLGVYCTIFVMASIGQSDATL
jgi:hypothetical protein